MIKIQKYVREKEKPISPNIQFYQIRNESAKFTWKF